ncbi:ATP-binding protein [Nannocystis pusilla]|uniref:ATP-binding protein n=1 Tax=Nannocystis pusilla TaxID=889268 RepID=UPI003BF04275
MNRLAAATRAPEPDAPPVLDLVCERVVLRVRRRLAWVRHLEQEEADPLARLGLDLPAHEARFYAASDELAGLQRRLAVVEAELDACLVQDAWDNPLRHLVHALGLDIDELELLQTCVAVERTPALAAALQRLTGVPGVTEELVRHLFGRSLAPLLRSTGALRHWRLVSERDAGPGVPAVLQLDPQVTGWLIGQVPVPAELAAVVTRPVIREPLSSWPVRQVLDALVDSLDAGVSVRLVVAGQPGSGRRSFAAAVFHALDLAGFVVDVAALADADLDERCRLVVRHARILNAIPIWHLPAEARALPAAAAEFGLAAVACAAHDRPAPVDGVVDLRVDLPAPDLAERAALWRRLVPTTRTWPEEHVLQVSRRYALPVGDLAAVGLRRPASVDAAAELCRERSRHRLGELGHVLRCPFDLADLVVPAKLRDHLAEFVFEARDRADFWERPEARRLYPRGTGLVALFTGPAGTGKTMAAQVLAAQLGQDLVRIDLATIVSKYIGETAKNLRKIFSVAAGMSAVLLFDEADALFARRTDVRDSHDRHANSDTNYLLQLLEDFAGVAVLASNKKANIDPAFIRRIRHVLEFPRPDAAARRQIWQQVLSELGADVSPAALDTLGGVDLSGAQIKNAVLAATFVARSEKRPLGVGQLVRGLERELDKDGRALERRDRERLVVHV